MLVITRRVGDKIFIVDKRTKESIEIILKKARGSAARIGIGASDNYRICRDEIKLKEEVNNE